MKIITGNAFYCGDYVNTDVISPGRFEPYQGRDHLASIALIDYESEIPFVASGHNHSNYKVIFAGVEFGCGSSRETAPQALNYAGAVAIIARSFARIFFRNCVNMGLIYPIIYDHPFDETVIGKEVTVNFSTRSFIVEKQEFFYENLGEVEKIITAGGLINYTKQSMGEIK